MATRPFFEQIDVFGIEGRDVHRIPSIVISTAGTVLAFCNRRIGSAADHGHDTHLVLRRSFDDGRTWGQTQVLYGVQGWAAGIGNAVVNRTSGTIMILYGRSLTDPDVNERSMVAGTRMPPPHPDAGTFMLRSEDDGATWSEERLTLEPNALGLVGSTHGGGPTVQLHYSPYEGRLVMPARVWTKRVFDLTRYPHNCAIYSDDGGQTWRTGGLVQAGTGEACIVETVGGAICLNSRQYHRLGRRGTAWSYDGGETFTHFGWDETLTDTLPSGCNASMIRYSDAVSGDRTRVLYAHPASNTRERMTVRVSYDECRTWPVSRVIHEGPSAYSTLAVTNEGTVLCFYERGDAGPYERMTVARFNIAWMEAGTDT